SFLGRAFLSQQGPALGEYPHNLIIESLMATGIVGGFFFIGWVFTTVFRGYKMLKLNYTAGWVALIFIQQVIFGMFSLSLFIHDRFWHFSVLVFIAWLTAVKHTENKQLST